MLAVIRVEKPTLCHRQTFTNTTPSVSKEVDVLGAHCYSHSTWLVDEKLES